MTLETLFSKEAFGIEPERAYLNVSQMAPLHRTVRAAGEAAILRKAEPWRGSAGVYLPELETARALFARLANATPDHVAVVPACSTAMAVAAANLEAGPGRRIVIAEGQFPSNILVWERKARETGAELVRVRRDAETGGFAQPLLAAIDERCAIVACDPLHWSDGRWNDAPAIAARAREVGAALVLDLTQTLGAAPVDLKALDPDFAACPTYKWLLGPYAQGFLYVAERHWDGRPLEEPGANRAGDGGYLPGARRYDMGEKSNFLLTPMTLAALELLLKAGAEPLLDALRQRRASLAAAVEEAGFATTPASDGAPHFFAASAPGADVEAIAARLAEERIDVSAREGRLRVSGHIWTTDSDAERLAEALRRLA